MFGATNAGTGFGDWHLGGMSFPHLLVAVAIPHASSLLSLSHHPNRQGSQ
jgi:hypothetical protein